MSDPSSTESPGLLALWWHEARVATAFLTRLPVHGDDLADTGVGQAARGFPIAGLAVGVVGGIVLILANALALPLAIASALAVAAMIGATGGLHEDGLADVADGFGGTHERDRTLEIMRDSRIGTYGVLALILAIGLRIMALAACGTVTDAILAVIAAAAGSRAALPLVLHRLAPARSDGLGHGAGRPEQRPVIEAAIFGAVLVLLGLGPMGAVLAIAGVTLATFLLSGLAERRIGGQTGDVLGAIQQTAEIIILLAAVATRS
jgi:adenosylcobinamide-GDP ribazoletransferase